MSRRQKYSVISKIVKVPDTSHGAPQLRLGSTKNAPTGLNRHRCALPFSRRRTADSEDNQICLLKHYEVTTTST
jgi:hypothetical protein